MRMMTLLLSDSHPMLVTHSTILNRARSRFDACYRMLSALHQLGPGFPCIDAWGETPKGGMVGRPYLGLGHRGTFGLYGFPLFCRSVRIASCRLRHSWQQERDSSPTGTFNN